MILSDLKRYVKSNQRVSLNDIANHFDIEPDAARGMLEFWVKKGKINQSISGASCSSGCYCDYKVVNDMYEWNPELNNISIQVS